MTDFTRRVSMRVSLAASVFAVAVGAAVLVGWALDIAMLKSVAPGFVSMKPNTAICFMLAGVALYLSQRGTPGSWSVIVARAFAAAVVAVASLSFAENVLGLDFGIDQALFSDVQLAGGVAPPGRMAYATAFSFMMIGLALLLSRGRSRTSIVAQLAALLPGLTGLLALISYIYGAQQDFTFGSNTAMAFNTAVTFIVMSAGVLAMSPGYYLKAIFISDRIGSVVARRVLAIGIGLPIVLGWLHLEGEERALYGHELGVALLVSSTIVTLTAFSVWVAISLNRTDEKRSRAEQALLSSEERFRIAAQSASDLIWEWDIQNGTLQWFGAIDTFLGYKNGEFPRTFEAWEGIVHPDDHDRVIATLEQHLKMRVPYIEEYQVRCKDGSYRYWTDKGEAVRDEEGNAVKMTGVCTDITERKRAEEELRQSNDRFDLAVHGTNDGIWDWEIESNTNYFSPRFCELLDYEPDELTHELATFETLLHPEDREWVFKRVRQHLEGRLPYDVEYRLRSKNGEYRWFRARGQAAWHKSGEPYRMAGSITDITERKRAEEDLRQQAELLELAHDAFVVQDNNNRILYWNHGAEETYGWKQEEALGKVAPALLNTRFPKPLEELKLEAGEKGFWEGELQQVTRAGAQMIVSSRWAVKADDGGDISGYLEINRDVTERNRAEQELKRIEWLFTRKPEAKSYEPAYGNLVELNQSRLILDSVGEELLSSITRDYLDLMGTSSAVYERNGDYAVGIFSSGWCRFMDLASREMCHTSDNREALNSGNWGCHESCWTRASKAAIETGKPVDIECFGGINLFAMPIFADEEIVGAINFGYGDPPKDPHALQEIASKCNADYDELAALSESYNTRPPFIIDLAKDRLRATAMLIGEIVERKQADEKVESLNEDLRSYAARLEEANRELEAFSYSVSHDLRAPLRAIDGFSKILMEDYRDKLDDEGRRFIGILRENTQKMANLIDDILTLSRLGRTEIELSDIDMGALARKVFKELRQATDGRVIDFQLREIPHAFGDSTLMYQVLTNLLSNAIKFTGPREKAAIEMGGWQDLGRNVYYVKDNGVGFDMKYADKLFGVFQRLHGAEEFEGTGAGLSIVRRAVQRQGGSVWAESEVDRGSTFCFALPLNLESSAEGRCDE